MLQLSSRSNGGQAAIIEHLFDVDAITAPDRHTREDEHSFVLEGEIGFRSDGSEVILGPGGYITNRWGRCTPCGTPAAGPAASSRS
jgi:quercetin dioxygenase-like cupin family protein